jgi:hypothetical protein
MNRVAELAARRESLLERSANLRAQLADHGEDLEHSLHKVDRGIHLARSVTAQPLLLAAGAGLLFTLGPVRAFQWVSRGLFVTSLARRAFGMFAAHRQRSKLAYNDDNTDEAAF